MKKLYVKKQSIFKIMSGLFMAMGLMSCGPKEPEVIPVTDIEFKALNGVYLPSKGKGIQFYAAAIPEDATNTELIWTTSDSLIATVDAEGLLTAVPAEDEETPAENKKVTVRVTAADNSAISKQIEVAVVPEVVWSTSLAVSGRTRSFVGKSFKLDTVIEPENVTDDYIYWTSSNTSVLTIDEAGTITAVGTGEAKITGKLRDGASNSVEHTLSITASPVPVESVSFESDTASGFMGGTLTLPATVYPESATNKLIRFESTDTSLATVDEEGNVTILADCLSEDKNSAEVKIIVTTICDEDSGDDSENYEAKSDEVTVTVKRPVSSINLLSTDYNTTFGIPVAASGNTATIVSVVSPANASDKSLNWTTSDETIATVDVNGVVTAVSAGNATITATANDGSQVKAEFNVTVYIPIQSILLSTSDSKTEYTALTTSQLVVTVNPENATYKEYSFNTPDGATVNAETLVVTMGDTAATPVITATSVQGAVTALDKFYIDNWYVYESELDATYYQGKLSASIEKANGKITAAVFGDADGQYPETSKTTLEAAITTAEAILTSTDKASLKTAQSTLEEAIVEFESSINGFFVAKSTDAIAASKWTSSLAYNLGESAYSSWSIKTGLSVMFDGNDANRWEPDGSEFVNEGEADTTERWIIADLGLVKSFKSVAFKLEAAGIKNLRFEISDDGSEWETVFTDEAASHEDYKTFTFNKAVSARYVKLVCTQRDMIPYGPSLFEFGVFAK